MLSQTQNSFEISSIHDKFEKHFLSPSRVSLEESNGTGHKNEIFASREQSVLQDLMDSSAISRTLKKREEPDARVPFFADHPLSGKVVLLQNLKKYMVMKKLGCLHKRKDKQKRRQRRRKRIISDDTWKKKYEETNPGNPYNNNATHASNKKAAKKLVSFKQRHWTITDFGRVEEPKNLLFDIKEKMRLNSDRKPDLLRDDSKIRSVTSFQEMENQLNIFSIKPADSVETKERPIILDSDENIKFKDVFEKRSKTKSFCTPEKIKKKVKNSPPKLLKKSAFHRRLNAKDSNLDFLKIKNQLWTDQLQNQQIQFNALDSGVLQKQSFKPESPKNEEVLLKSESFKSKKNFLSGFHEIFSSKSSVKQNAAHSSNNSSTQNMQILEKASPIKVAIFANQCTSKLNDCTTLCTDEPSKTTKFQSSLNWSRNNNLHESLNSFINLNRSTDFKKSFRKNRKNKNQLARFLGKKMTKSDGDDPRPLPSIRANVENLEVQPAFQKQSTADLLFPQNILSNKNNLNNFSGQSSLSNSSINFILKENSSLGQPSEIPSSKFGKEFSDKSILNKNVITFNSRSIFGDIDERESDSEMDLLANPFEKIELNLDVSDKEEDRDLDRLLEDPCPGFLSGGCSMVEKVQHRVSLFAFD